MTAPRTTQAIARGVLLGTFAGDALGARWEGAPAVELDEGRRRLERSLAAEVLHYTDDTQLTLALAEHLCDHPGVEQPALVATFLDHFEGHRGYARGMFGLVEAWHAGTAPAEAATSVFPDGSFGNGAAMRVAPVGVMWARDDTACDAAARRSAVITHAHAIGADAAAAQARAVARAVRSGGFTVDDLQAVRHAATTKALRTALGVAQTAAQRWLAGERPPVPDLAQEIGTGVLADQSVPAALWVAAVAGDFEEAVLLALALGGDVDTIAAMACAVAGAALTIEAIPPAWLAPLEDERRGRSYAYGVADRLAATAQARAPG